MLETRSRLGVLRGRLTFLWWPGAKVDVLHPFLLAAQAFWPGQEEDGACCGGMHRAWPGAMCLLEYAQEGPENICIGIRAGNRWLAPKGQLGETAVRGIWTQVGAGNSHPVQMTAWPDG